MEKVSSFEELILLSSRKKEIQLKYDLENNVSLIKFFEGKIDISFNENLDKNFVHDLSKKLLEWTGTRWVITLTKKRAKKLFLSFNLLKRKNYLIKKKREKFTRNLKIFFQMENY